MPGYHGKYTILISVFSAVISHSERKSISIVTGWEADRSPGYRMALNVTLSDKVDSFNI